MVSSQNQALIIREVITHVSYNDREAFYLFSVKYYSSSKWCFFRFISFGSDPKLFLLNTHLDFMDSV